MQKKIIMIFIVIIALVSIMSMSVSALSVDSDYLSAVSPAFYRSYFYSGNNCHGVFYEYDHACSITFNPSFDVPSGCKVLVEYDVFCSRGVHSSWSLSFLGVTKNRSSAVSSSDAYNYGFDDLSGTIYHYSYYVTPSNDFSNASLVFNLSLANGYSIGEVGIINFKLNYDINNLIKNEINASENRTKAKIQEEQEKQTNETFDYEKKSNNNTDEGLSSGGNLLDSLNDSIDDFNSSIDNDTDNLIDSIDGIKDMVHGVFDIIPAILQYLIVFAVLFLVIRKVVGR